MSSEKDGFKSKKVLACDSKARFRKSRVSEPEALKADLAKSITVLPKHELEELTTTIRKEYIRRFKRRKIRKYGSLSKSFTEIQVQLFFKVIENDKFRLLFSYQAQLGLRIDEVVRVNIKHINFNTRNPADNRLANLMLICPNPHRMLTREQQYREAVKKQNQKKRNNDDGNSSFGLGDLSMGNLGR